MDVSRLFVSRVSLLVMLAIFSSGCVSFVARGDRPVAGNTNSHTSSSQVNSEVHIVARGETLFSIAWENGHDYRDVARWNGIRPPYTIYPRQRLRLTPPKKQLSSAPTHNRKKITGSSASQAKPASPRPVSRSHKVKWQWPSQGQIISRFSSQDASRRGIDISGKKGQAIYAAADGYVVYAGNGLRGYGNLVILKHSDTLFSAYAHNESLRVKEKEKVKSGQRIADMGNTGTDGYKLHFEIRRNGKPVNPLNYLPKR